MSDIGRVRGKVARLLEGQASQVADICDLIEEIGLLERSLVHQRAVAAEATEDLKIARATITRLKAGG